MGAVGLFNHGQFCSSQARTLLHFSTPLPFSACNDDQGWLAEKKTGVLCRKIHVKWSDLLNRLLDARQVWQKTTCVKDWHRTVTDKYNTPISDARCDCFRTKIVMEQRWDRFMQLLLWMLDGDAGHSNENCSPLQGLQVTKELVSQRGVLWPCFPPDNIVKWAVLEQALVSRWGCVTKTRIRLADLELTIRISIHPCSCYWAQGCSCSECPSSCVQHLLLRMFLFL